MAEFALAGLSTVTLGVVFEDLEVLVAARFGGVVEPFVSLLPCLEGDFEILSCEKLMRVLSVSVRVMFLILKDVEPLQVHVLISAGRWLLDSDI